MAGVTMGAGWHLCGQGRTMDGNAMHLDIDGFNGQIRVWFELNSVLKWAKLEYTE